MLMLAPAKINLFLEVLGPRPDGYHAIRTVFLPVEGLADAVEVDFAAETGLFLTCTGPVAVPSGEDNICVRAARVFCQHFAVAERHHLQLQKNIPAIAGLGGGSSDAAAVLLVMSALHALPAERYAELVPLAAALGADVPFFLNPAPSLGAGIGDCLTPVALGAAVEILLLNPGFPLPVAWAYQKCRRPAGLKPPAFQSLPAILAEGLTRDIAAIAWNDLEFAIFDKFPLLQILRERLLQLGALAVHISGSGPTLFAICPTGLNDEMQRVLQREFAPPCWVFAGRIRPNPNCNQSKNNA